MLLKLQESLLVSEEESEPTPEELFHNWIENLMYQKLFWSRDALCEDESYDMFPVRAVDQEQTATMCTACPVRLQCLTFAVALKEEYGVWGGTSESTRKKLISSIHSHFRKEKWNSEEEKRFTRYIHNYIKKEMEKDTDSYSVESVRINTNASTVVVSGQNSSVNHYTSFA